MLILTIAKLTKAGADEETVQRFRRKFGRNARVKVDQKLCLEHPHLFKWEWACSNLLSPDQRLVAKKHWKSASRKYRAAVAALDDLAGLAYTRPDAGYLAQNYRYARQHLVTAGRAAYAAAFAKGAESPRKRKVKP